MPAFSPIVKQRGVESSRSGGTPAVNVLGSTLLRSSFDT
jgi:hypothetical protein